MAMKNKLITLSLSILLVLLGFLIGHYKLLLIHKIFRKTITVQEFLKDKNANKWDELGLNGNGDIIYKNKIIVKEITFKPLSYGNTNKQEEMKILYLSGWYKTRGFDI